MQQPLAEPGLHNVAERASRPMYVLEAFLFVGSKRGGETAAIFMILIATCKTNGVNCLPESISAPPIGELLPHNRKTAGEKK